MQIDIKNVVNFPTEYYVGVQDNKKFDTEKPPLAFATPNGTDAAFKKRKATVDSWARGYKKPEKEGLIVKNDPQEGFYLKDWTSRWHTQNKWFNVIDPRGFHLQLSAAALTDLINDATLIKGVIQGKCVWGRRGSEHVLVPIDSEMYKQANALLALPSTYQPGDYVFMQKRKYVYLGQFYQFDIKLTNQKVSTSYTKPNSWHNSSHAWWHDGYDSQTKKFRSSMVTNETYDLNTVMQMARRRYGNVESEPVYSKPKLVYVYMYVDDNATKITDNWFSFTTKKSMAKAQNMGASGMDITKLRQEYNKKSFGVSTSVREDYPKNIISNTIHGYKCFVMDATELQAFKDNWETYKITLKCRSNPIVTYKETKELAKYLNSKRRYEWVFEVDPNIN